MLNNMAKVAASNLCTMAAGILVGFLLPKIIGVTDYGYYKTFTLYATYVGLFHFGIEDGIYLIYGGKDYDELDRGSFRFYSRFLIFLELVISLVGAGVALLFLPGELKFVFVAVAGYLFACNIVNYYRFVSQITCRFNEYSVIDIIRSALTVISIVVMWVLYRFVTPVGYRLFTIFYVAIYVLLAVWYMFTYRDITFGRSMGIREGRGRLLEFLKAGFPLMVANLASTLILTIDRQFVNLLFDNDTYAVYAFAYNMLTLVTTATSAISTVLYPALKRTDIESLKKNYSRSISVLMIAIFGCLLIYFPLYVFVTWYLPQFAGALVIFRIILPGLAISAPITIIMHNYYKAMGANLSFFIKSIIVLGLSALANTVTYLIFHTTISISIASVFVMAIWYLLTEHYFVRRHRTPWLKNLSYLALMVTAFYLITWIPNVYIGGGVYLVVYAGTTLLFFVRELRELAHRGGEAPTESAVDTHAEPHEVTVENTSAEASSAGEDSSFFFEE